MQRTLERGARLIRPRQRKTAMCARKDCETLMDTLLPDTAYTLPIACC